MSSSWSASLERMTIVLQACRGAQDRGQRRAQIVRNRGQQCRTQPFRFGRHPDLFDIPREIDPLDCQRRLIGKRAEQPMLIAAEQGARTVVVQSDNSNRTAPGMHRKEQPLCAR